MRRYIKTLGGHIRIEDEEAKGALPWWFIVTNNFPYRFFLKKFLALLLLINY